jgi:hypothetical protein
MSTIFEELKETAEFQEQLKQIPEEERLPIIMSIKDLIEKFENMVLKPLENLKTK